MTDKVPIEDVATEWSPLDTFRFFAPNKVHTLQDRVERIVERGTEEIYRDDGERAQAILGGLMVDLVMTQRYIGSLIEDATRTYEIYMPKED